MNRRAQALHGMAFLLVACLAQAEPFGYVINSDSLSDTDFDQLYRVDLSTGDATLIGPVGYGDVEGLALSPSGVLYGADDATETLIVIDTETGEGSPVNNTARNLTLGPDGLELGANHDFGLTFDFEGRLWLSSDVTGQIWSVDPDTGEPNLVSGGSGTASIVTASGDGGKSHGGSSPHLTGLAGCGIGFYGITATSSHDLYRMASVNGTPRRIGALGAGLEFDDAGADFDGTGTLWGIADRSRVGDNVLSEPSIIFSVNLETGAASRVATTVVGVESLAVAPPSACLSEQLLSHRVDALSRTGLAFLVLLIGLGAGLALRYRPGL